MNQTLMRDPAVEEGVEEERGRKGRRADGDVCSVTAYDEENSGGGWRGRGTGEILATLFWALVGALHPRDFSFSSVLGYPDPPLHLLGTALAPLLPRRTERVNGARV